jgi:hypothetical protein
MFLDNNFTILAPIDDESISEKKSSHPDDDFEFYGMPKWEHDSLESEFELGVHNLHQEEKVHISEAGLSSEEFDDSENDFDHEFNCSENYEISSQNPIQRQLEHHLILTQLGISVHNPSNLHLGHLKLEASLGYDS